jgi:hypothetical protein
VGASLPQAASLFLAPPSRDMAVGHLGPFAAGVPSPPILQTAEHQRVRVENVKMLTDGMPPALPMGVLR